MISQVEIYSIEIPLKQQFAHAQAKRSHSESVIVVLKHANGVAGIGECAPRQYVTGEIISSVLNHLQKINIIEWCNHIDFANLEIAIKTFQQQYFILKEMTNGFPNVLCVLEMAALDLIGKYFSCHLGDILKKYYLPAVFTNAKINIIPTTQVMDFSISPKDFLQQRGPFHTIKIKVGRDLDQNIEYVSFIRNALGPEIPIIVDANMAWDFDEALCQVNALQKFHIGYYEEPLAKQNFSDYKNLRIKTQCKILLDESLCTTQDAMHAVQHQACDALNIRLAKCGGFIQSIEILKISLANKISYQIGVQVAETGPLLAASRIMASITNDYFAYEAGQPDRQFEQYIISPMPIVDRSTNYATPIHGSGLGVYLNEKFKQYIKQEIICQGKKTYEKT